jgi:hypothetical protein
LKMTLGLRLNFSESAPLSAATFPIIATLTQSFNLLYGAMDELLHLFSLYGYRIAIDRSKRIRRSPPSLHRDLFGTQVVGPGRLKAAQILRAAAVSRIERSARIYIQLRTLLL